MKLNRKSLTLGIAGLGFAGALTLGIGAAQADTTTPSPSAATPICDQQGGMRGGWAAGQNRENSPMVAAASYLGLSQTDLRTKLRAGTSLAEIAKAQNKSVTGLVDAMVAAAKSNIEANSNLTADQKSAALEQVKTRMETRVNATHPAGAADGTRGGPRGGMRGGMGR
jgi:hypothetical protein